MKRIRSSKSNGRFSCFRGLIPSVLICALSIPLAVACMLCLSILFGMTADFLSKADALEFNELHIYGSSFAIALSAFVLAQYNISASSGRIACRFEARLRSEAVSRLRNLPMRSLDAYYDDDLVKRILSDTHIFAATGTTAAVRLLRITLILAGALAYMIHISLGASIVVLLGAPVSLTVSEIVRRKRTEFEKSAAESAANYANSIHTLVATQSARIALGCRADSAVYFDRICMPAKDSVLRFIHAVLPDNLVVRFTNSVILSCAAVSGSLSAVVGGMHIGELVCYTVFASVCLGAFRQLPDLLTDFKSAVTSARRVFAYLDLPVEAQDSKTDVSSKNYCGRVEFKGVSLRCPPDPRTVRRFSVHASPGKSIGIVDPNGAIGFEISNLLLRFTRPDRGRILLDGVSIDRIHRSSLRNLVGVIPSEPWLMHATVRENIALFCPDADEKAIKTAAEAAHADRFIRRLPKGYETMLDVDGISESFRRSICLARAFLSPKPIMIIESMDALLELDPKVRYSVLLLIKNKTVIQIARKSGSLIDPDTIFDLENDSDLVCSAPIERVP